MFSDVALKSLSTEVTSPNENIKSDYDAIVVGGGHNGLVSVSWFFIL